MKISEIINENLLEGVSDDLFKSFMSLVKYNDGLFKSEKQAAYLKKFCDEHGQFFHASTLGFKDSQTNWYFDCDDKGVTKVTKETRKGGEKIVWKREASYIQANREKNAQVKAVRVGDIQTNLKKIDDEIEEAKEKIKKAENDLKVTILAIPDENLRNSVAASFKDMIEKYKKELKDKEDTKQRYIQDNKTIIDRENIPTE